MFFFASSSRSVDGLLTFYLDLVGINLYAGILLAQLHVDLGSRATTIMPRFVPGILMISGLFLWSFPQEHPEWAPWSRVLKTVFVATTPGGTDTNRYAFSVGITLLMLGIFFSTNARKFLTSPLFNFLGRVSFPVYLLHNTLIRTILVLMVYGPNAARTPLKNPEGHPVEVKRASPMTFIFIIPVFYAVLYLVAYSWLIYVDPVCAKIVDWMKNKMFIDDEKPSQEKVLPVTRPPVAQF